MIASPASSRSASSLTVLSVISPAGTMTQTARGLSSLATKSSSESAPVAPSPASVDDGVGVDVVDDALVAVAHQPANDVRAHPPEADHAELHGADPKPIASATRLRVRDAEADSRHPGHLRDHRRPGPQDDLRGALPARAPRRAQLPRVDRVARSTTGTTTTLASHAREAIEATVADPDEEVIDRLERPARLRPGRLRRGRDLQAARARRWATYEQAGLLPRDPAVAVRRGGHAARRRPGSPRTRGS